MPVHELVRNLAHEAQISHQEAEDLLRGRALRDPHAKKAIDEIDRCRESEKQAALKLNQEMAQRLGLPLNEVSRLVMAIASDQELETWFQRRVQLARVTSLPPGDDWHPVNI